MSDALFLLGKRVANANFDRGWAYGLTQDVLYYIPKIKWL
jgi:hypothetical protein